jgi:hypothetical protein
MRLSLLHSAHTIWMLAVLCISASACFILGSVRRDRVRKTIGD